LSLKQLSYRAIAPRLLAQFHNARMFYRRACIYLLVRFPIPHSPHAYYFRAEKETTELRCAIKIIPPTSFSFLPSPFRCRSLGRGQSNLHE